MRRLANVLLAIAFAACAEDKITKAEAIADATPSLVSFSEVPVGFLRARTVTIRNTGIVRMEISARVDGATDDLRISLKEATLAGGQSAEIDVTWQPTQLDELDARLIITTDSKATPELVVPINGQPIARAFTLAEDPIDFGRVRIGRTFERTVTLTNHTAEPIEVSIAPPLERAISGFSVQSDPRIQLDGHGTSEVTLTFTPQLVGQAIDSIRLYGDCGSDCTLEVSLVGEGANSSLICDPPVLNFKQVNPHTCIGRVVSCRNLFDVPVTVEALDLTPPAVELTLSPAGLPRVLDHNEAIDIGVTFCPTALRRSESKLQVLASEPDLGQRSVSVTVIGEGGGPDVRVTPSSLFLGGQLVGGLGTRNISIDNVGVAVLEVSELIIDPPNGAFSVMTDPMSIAPGNGNPLEVRFNPSAAGEHTGRLLVRSNDPDQPEVVVNLAAVAVDDAPCELAVEPSAVSFGLVGVGERNRRTVHLRANGANACEFFDPRIESDALFFTNQMQRGTIDPGGSSDVEVSYAPIAASGQGGDSGMLLIDVPNVGGTIRVPLSGVAAPVDLVVHPNPIDFDKIGLDHPRTRTLAIYNVGTAPHEITELEILAGSSLDFSLAPQNLPIQIQPGVSHLVDVVYDPSTVGIDEGAISVTSASLPAPLFVQLIGEAGDDPCGHLTGRICAPDGGDSVGTSVMVETAGGVVHQTQTDENGNFHLYCLPPGQVQIDVQRGHFRAISQTTINAHATTILPSDVCLEAGSVEIAVATGAYDTVEEILTSLSLDYDLHDGIAFSPPDLLTDPQLLNSYDVVFLNCGLSDLGDRDPVIVQNLRDFVAGGGSVYASDWAYDAVEGAFPNAIDFYGNDQLQDSAQFGFNTLLSGQVLDPAILSRLGGQALVTVTFSGGYALIDDVGPGATIHVAGPSQGAGAGLKPLLVSFEPFGGGQPINAPPGGRVIYTSFHNSDVIVDAGMRLVLEFLVFAL